MYVCIYQFSVNYTYHRLFIRDFMSTLTLRLTNVDFTEKMLLVKMTREVCKKTKSKYFESSSIGIDLSTETSHLADFASRYADYVLKRAKTFTSSFEEMRLVAHGMRTEDICAQVDYRIVFFERQMVPLYFRGG